MRLNGYKGSLHDHMGRTTLLHFWATWCAPCLVELPELIELASKQPNIVILAISTDQKTSEITRFIKKTGKTIPKNFIIITDPDKSITQDHFQTFKLPETYILSPQLAIHKKIIGANDQWTSPETIESLQILSE
jgi:thiol-disulfide isomerase/thioredoxin